MGNGTGKKVGQDKGGGERNVYIRRNENYVREAGDGGGRSLARAITLLEGTGGAGDRSLARAITY